MGCLKQPLYEWKLDRNGSSCRIIIIYSKDMPIQEFTMQLLFLREWEIILPIYAKGY